MHLWARSGSMFEGSRCGSKIYRVELSRRSGTVDRARQSNISREGEVMQVRTSLGRQGLATGPCAAVRSPWRSLAGSSGAAHAQRADDLTPSPPGAEVYFVDLKDGAVVPAKFKIYFGLRNMGVAPAGSDTPNTGHHHLIDRHRAAAARSADPERLQSPAFRRRPDRGRDHAVARRAHAAAAHGRQGSYSAHAAGDVAAHHASTRRCRSGGPTPSRAGRRGLFRRPEGRRRMSRPS